MSITLDISTQQKHDSQMDEFKTLLLSVTQRELEAHYLTEAKKRLEILTLVAREILSANILKDGAYKIEFVLDKSTTSGVDMPFTQSFNTMFAADSVRMTIDGNTVLYGVKTTHSSMYKMERDVGRLDKGTADENESNIRKEAIALLEKLDRQKNKLNPTEKKELEALRAGVKKWIAFETEMRQGLGSFVADSKKTQEVVEKLNSITRKVIEIKKVRSQKLAKLQKEFIGGLRIRPWPFERPETLLSAFKTASQRSALDNFTVKYLKVIANGQYKGTLSQTNYEPLHGAVVWLRKLVEGGEIENTELVVRKFSALSQKVRAYEKKIRHIAGAITDISLERRLKYLCELQKCRYEVLDAIKEASVAIARLESEGLSLIQNELYRLARNVGKLDFKVEGTLAEEMFKRAGKQQSSDIKFVKSVLARYNNNLPVLEVGLESKRKGIDDAKKTYRENWT
ncbi:hypothetical protein FJZ26_00190, partial [Candidatus Parvarchaeota archaeon]|nr:hypothetical protein [Candidatus Parvarchaeota archaeon]